MPPSAMYVSSVPKIDNATMVSRKIGVNKVKQYFCDAHRDVALPSPVNGMVIGNRARGCVQQYTGERWENSGPARPIYQGRLLGYTDRVGSWALTSGYGQPRIYSAESHGGLQSLHLKCSPTPADRAIQAIWTPASAINLTGKYLLFRVLPLGFDTIANVSIRLRCGSASNYYEFIWYKETGFLYDGWSQARLIGSADMTTGGTVDIANVTNVVVGVSTSAGGGNVHDVVLDLACVYEDNHPAIVTIGTDDGLSWNVDTAKAILDASGFTATAFVHPSSIGTDGKMTVAQLQTLQTAGWDISSHAWQNDDSTTLTAAELRTSLGNTRSWLIANGFSAGADYMSWPQNANNPATREIAKEYCVLARGGTVTTQFHAPIPPTFEGMWELPGYGLDSVADADVETFVDAVIARKAHAHLYFHNKTAANFQHDIEYLATKVATGTLVVMNMSQYYQWLTRRFAGNWYTDNSTLYS